MPTNINQYNKRMRSRIKNLNKKLGETRLMLEAVELRNKRLEEALAEQQKYETKYKANELELYTATVARYLRLAAFTLEMRENGEWYETCMEQISIAFRHIQILKRVFDGKSTDLNGVLPE